MAVNNSKIYSVVGAGVLLLAASCQKVINVNLNSSAPQYVVEGNVTDQPGPYMVKLTRSVNFDQDNVFPAVSGAKVIITDTTAGLRDSLIEVTPGIYQTQMLTGVSGHTYNLYINYQGKVLTAQSTMPQPVLLDSMQVRPQGFRGNSLAAVPYYFDPVAKGNFYHFVMTVNDTVSTAIYVRNDQLVNGQLIQQPLSGGDGGVTIRHGDSLTVSMECIDSMVYQFYYTLRNSQNSNSATPTNPVSNIKGGQSLGYFSAHTVSALSTQVPF